MKKKIVDSLKTVVIIFVFVFLCNLIAEIPWWGFIIPVMGLGTFITRKQWHVSFFFTGFLCGFLIWVGGNLFYHWHLPGHIFTKFRPAAGVLLLLASGVAGGLVTGLALYTGKSIVYDKKKGLTL
jgi:hypothetical protein